MLVFYLLFISPCLVFSCLAVYCLVSTCIFSCLYLSILRLVFVPVLEPTYAYNFFFLPPLFYNPSSPCISLHGIALLASVLLPTLIANGSTLLTVNKQTFSCDHINYSIYEHKSKLWLDITMFIICTKRVSTLEESFVPTFSECSNHLAKNRSQPSLSGITHLLLDSFMLPGQVVSVTLRYNWRGKDVL